MARVTITIEDRPDGQVSVKVDAKPALPGPASSKAEQKAATDAQVMALELFVWLSQRGDISSRSVTADGTTVRTDG